MFKQIFWWILESIIWFLFIYLIIYSGKNEVNIAGMSLILVLLGSFGIFASPLTRHLSIWNKVLDRIIKKEEDEQKF